MKRIFAIALVMMLMGCAAMAQSAPAASTGMQPAAAKPKPPRVSPAGTADFTFADGKKVTINYSRPYRKDPKTGEIRKIYGELVPFDQVWRTGANEATSLKTDVDLDINGTKVPAGSYTVYSIPSQGTSKLIINKQTGQWGTIYDEKKDLARIDLTVTDLPAPVEQFTIAFEKQSADSANLNFDWETKRASVVVKEAGKNQDMPVQK
jgi:Protein of unknown function (DUF2911)